MLPLKLDLLVVKLLLPAVLLLLFYYSTAAASTYFVPRAVPLNALQEDQSCEFEEDCIINAKIEGICISAPFYDELPSRDQARKVYTHLLPALQTRVRPQRTWTA